VLAEYANIVQGWWERLLLKELHELLINRRDKISVKF
jgi:hypothetical protein